MPRIYVQFAGLDRIGTRCKAVASSVDRIQSEFQQTVRRLDWDVRYEANINNTASQIAKKLDRYSSALKAYQSFIDDAYGEYVKLDEYDQKVKPSLDTSKFTQIVGPSGLIDYDWKDVIESFGNVGGLIGIVDGLVSSTTWNEWANVALNAGKTIFKIAKDYKNYTRIGRAIGSKNAMAYFWRKQLGFNNVGYASTASSPSARFYNNLHNTTSPYNLNDAFAPLTGQKGVGTTIAAWAGVALTGIANAFSNIEEQKASNGNMSTGRVVAETISETAIDTIVTYAGTAVVGAAITAATGVVAAPVAVAVATGVAIAGINAGVKAITGKSATEWVSDAVLDTACAVGNAVADGAKAVADWFGKLSFA